MRPSISGIDWTELTTLARARGNQDTWRKFTTGPRSATRILDAARLLDRVAIEYILGRIGSLTVRNPPASPRNRFAGHASQCFVYSAHFPVVLFPLLASEPRPSGRQDQAAHRRGDRRAWLRRIDWSQPPVRRRVGKQPRSSRIRLLSTSVSRRTIPSARRSSRSRRSRSKSRHTSRTMSRPTGCLPSAMPLTSALSQMTLMRSRNPTGVLMNQHDRFAREEPRGFPTGRANAARDVDRRLLELERPELATQGDSLLELTKARLVQPLCQLRLPGEDQRQQLLRRRLDVRQQAHLLEQLRTERLGFVHHERRDLSAATPLLQYVLERRQQDRLGLRSLAPELEPLRQRFDELAARQRGIVDVDALDIPAALGVSAPP